MSLPTCPIILESNKTSNTTKLESKLKDFSDEFFEVFPSLKPYKQYLFIAGGSIRSLILDEPIKDVDIFITHESVIGNIKDLLLGRGLFSDNAINLYMWSNSLGVVKVQIITTETGLPQEVINQFDFTMNMNYYDISSNSIYVHSMEDILSKTLRVNKNCRNKLGTLARIVKFTKRGYELTSKENLLELGCQISRMEPISTFKELEAESRLYFSGDDYDSIDFVEKDVLSTAKFESLRVGSGF